MSHYEPNPKIKFERDCFRASEETGVPVYFFGLPDKSPKRQDFYEDDGNLHLFKGGGWGCFDVGGGQNLTGKEQNSRTRAVMEFLGLQKHITDRVLVDETEEDDDDCCPCCGQRH